MRKELDELLCSRYPKLFRDRHAPMQQTCMCWGFDCGDGWFDVIDVLCSNIQSHIDWSRKNRANSLKYNRALRQAIAGNTTSLVRYFTFGLSGPNEHTHRSVSESLNKLEFREVPEACPQVIVEQVKEKYGTLRFYFYGGDDNVIGMVRLAESMTSRICEVCGCPAKTESRGGWVSTRCDQHKDK